MTRAKAKTKTRRADDGRPRLIGLIRVSTGKQAESGLGLESQAAIIETYRAGVNGRLLRSYREVESGMHDDIDSRPQLRKAISDANMSRARLVIAKLDRLARSTSVMAYIKRTGVKFTACDLPNANELTIDLMIAVRAEEGRAIGTRTRDALKAYRDGKRVGRRIVEKYDGNVPPEIVAARAGKLGAELPECRNLSALAQARGTVAAAEARSKAAAEAYDHLLPTMQEMRAEKKSFQAIADHLNAEEHFTRNDCDWNRGQVKRVLNRAGVA
jgi:DNA invertase Pin-like site-specific DNA recombinase